MNTIKYEQLKLWYLNDTAKEMAKKIFGDRQPSILETGFYSAPSWNWGYHIGIVGVILEGGGTPQYFEVCTQFGTVVGARYTSIPVIIKDKEN